MGDKQCNLCHSNEGRYVCPVCETLYCSVNCFRSERHSECSEDFYRRCVEEELKFQQKISSTDDMSAILKRNQNLVNSGPIDSDDESDGIGDINPDGDDDSDAGSISSSENETDKRLEDLAKRMENVDLNNESEIWEKLKLIEKKEFERLVQSGGIRNILPDWEPWWMVIRPNLFITEIYGENEDSCKNCVCPPLNVEIPPFTELTKKKPAPNIPFMMANVLMSYASTARWFKGKHFDLPVESITSIFALSCVVRKNKILSSFSEAFYEFQKDLNDCKWLIKTDIDVHQIWKDVFHIVKGSKGSDLYFSVKASLCDIYNLITKSSEILKVETAAQLIHFRRFTGPSPTLSQIKLLSKKIIFYLSWIETFGQQLIDATTGLELEKFMENSILTPYRESGS